MSTSRKDDGDRKRDRDRGLPHEKQNGDVAFKKDSAHKAIPYLKALLAHDRTPSPERIAEILDQHQTKLETVVHFLHEHFGNKFVHRVLEAHKKLKQHSHNEHMDDFNKKADFGFDREGKKTDPNRLTDGGKLGKVATATAIYKGDGAAFDPNAVRADSAAENDQPPPAPVATSIIEVAAGTDVRLNTGGYAVLTINGQPTECVMVFSIGNSIAHATGYIPVPALTPESAALVQKDKKITQKLHKEGAKEHYSTKARKVVPHRMPPEYEELRTEPGMKDPGVSRIEHYSARPGGVVNLLVNVPGSDDSRFGVAIDILTAATQFFPSTTVQTQHTPLYRFGSGKPQSNKVLTFVYGKAVTGGRVSYGWINHAMLG